MNWLTCTAVLFLTGIVWYFSSLPKNIQHARKTGLPMLIRPILPSNLVWLVFATSIQPKLERWLPAAVWDYLAITVTGWEFRDGWKTFGRKGASFIVVTPGGNEVWIADPSLATDILQRRKDFLQQEVASRMMSFFGPSVTASNGDEWQRQRKFVAPTLNERIMHAVWDETRSQARDMLDHLSDGKPEVITNEVDRGIRMMTINVIGLIAFGSRSTWVTSFTTETPPKGYKLTFIDALVSVANNFIVAVFVPTHILRHPMMPAAAQKLAIAVEEFPRYVKQSIYSGEKNAGSTNSLVKTLAGMMADDDSPASSRICIREEEIVGNLFNFTVAGYDTTANTILYAFLLLALEPSWQQWVTEEVDQLSALNMVSNYIACFPAAKRCLAFLFETLRLYTPLLRVTRYTDTTQSLGRFRLPAGSNVFVATGSIHVSPNSYGPDPLEFRPTRWLKVTEDASKSNVEVVNMPKGMFLPWSEGPRHCPGTKMAQVEFVAALCQVLSTWELRIAVREGQTHESAKQSIRKLMAESQPRIALQLRDPKQAYLQFVKR